MHTRQYTKDNSIILLVIIRLQSNYVMTFRLGVNACGYEDKEVESLRSKLSAFLRWDTTTRAGLPTEIAIVSALLGLLSLDFKQIIQINTKRPTIASQSVPADHIRKWFSSLSKENQALSFSLLQCAES